MHHLSICSFVCLSFWVIFFVCLLVCLYGCLSVSGVCLYLNVTNIDLKDKLRLYFMFSGEKEGGRERETYIKTTKI